MESYIWILPFETAWTRRSLEVLFILVGQTQLLLCELVDFYGRVIA